MRKPATPESVFADWIERDLTAAAARGELAPAFELDDAVALAEDVLEGGHNVIVAGPSGVGRTTLVHQLVIRAHGGEGAAPLRGRRVLQCSFRQRVASLKDPKQIQPETKRLIDALCESAEPVVPFFRDIHLVYNLDLEEQLQALTYRFRGPVIGEAEPDRLATLFEVVPHLEQQYVTVSLDEPTLARTRSILDGWAQHQAASTGRHFQPEALEEALHLSHRFLPRGRQPRKSLDLLVQVAGTVGAKAAIDRKDVITRFAKVHRVPSALVDPAQPLDLEALTGELAAQLLGQDEAVDALSRMIGRIKSGLSDARRPFGVFLFAGPTGVGKTHAAQLLAQYIFGSRERLIRLNMADYQADGSAAALFGDPVAYQLPTRRGVLTQRLTGHPFAVLLLDEFEKAHEKIADQFLQLFDEGTFINGNAETVVCRSLIVIATSNLGAELHRDQPMGFFASPGRGGIAHGLERRLAERFRVELVNRFDEVVHFWPLSRADVRTIAAREIAALTDRIGFKRSGLTLDVDEAVLDWLAVHGYEPRFGARFLRRTLERHVTSALAELLAKGEPPSGSRAELTVRRNRIAARLVLPERDAEPSRHAVSLPLGPTTATRQLDRTALEKKVAEILQAAAGLFVDLDRKKGRAEQLLAALNASGFQYGSADGRAALDEYRDLDVAIQTGERYSGALRELEAASVTSPPTVAQLARQVERAARALHDWTSRLADDGPHDVWLVIETADALSEPGGWVVELAEAERAWCERLQLDAECVACGWRDREIARVVLRVEGPGAAGLLVAEEGIHRRVQRVGPDRRVRVDVVPRGSHDGLGNAVVRDAKARNGPLGLRSTCTGSVELSTRGLTLELAGSDPAVLRELLLDLERARRLDTAGATGVARVYGKNGVGARDPRTGASVLRLRDALKGEFEAFLDAWRARRVEHAAAQES